MNTSQYNHLLDLPFHELIAMADNIRAQSNSKVSLCTILNAKSGLCSEDCKFCAQSSHHTSEIQVYPLVSKEVIINAAKKAASNGAKRFGIVTSGNSMEEKDLNVIADAAKDVISEIGIKVCASLGHLSKYQLYLQYI